MLTSFWKGSYIPAAGEYLESCLMDRLIEEISLRETVGFLLRRLVRVKYRRATNRHIGINGLMRTESRLTDAILEAAVAALLAAAGLTNAGRQDLASISTSVYAREVHKSITALNQPRQDGEGLYVL